MTFLLCDFSQDSWRLVLSPQCSVYIAPNKWDRTGSLDDMTVYSIPAIVLNDRHSETHVWNLYMHTCVGVHVTSFAMVRKGAEAIHHSLGDSGSCKLRSWQLSWCHMRPKGLTKGKKQNYRGSGIPGKGDCIEIAEEEGNGVDWRRAGGLVHWRWRREGCFKKKGPLWLLLSCT